MRFEHYSQPILPLRKYFKRVAFSIWLATTVIGSALTIGIMGYHNFGNLSWIDSIVEASMILGGMGAVSPMTTTSVKLFASAYALFSGLILVSTTGILLAPWLHRLLHHLQAERRGTNRDVRPKK